LIIVRTNTGNMHKTADAYRNLFLVCIMLAPLLLSGCGHFSEGIHARPIFQEANDFSSRGEYSASLGKYRQIIETYPSAVDRALFEMGILCSYPGNEQKDYQKSLEYFQKLVDGYPESSYRKDSEILIFTINNVIIKDKTIAAQQKHIETLQQTIASKGAEISSLENTVTALEREIRNREYEVARQQELARLQKVEIVTPKGPADRILIEKGDRRLTLIAQGTALKTYQIALGGNPIGPKERQGDNKTPEGTYVIDSRNKDSRYHLSLHISYPNENDKKRAKQLGVSPGGDIMIHGIKNGFSWAGDLHTEVDWTKGCIAVTDEEIEEIEALVPNGTIVEIRP